MNVYLFCLYFSGNAQYTISYVDESLSKSPKKDKILTFFNERNKWVEIDCQIYLYICRKPNKSFGNVEIQI